LHFFEIDKTDLSLIFFQD